MRVHGEKNEEISRWIDDPNGNKLNFSYCKLNS
jgi:hypothetical protein